MSALTVLASLILGAFAFTLIEYVHHWHGGHLGLFGARVRRSHQAHHRDPLEGGVRLATKYRQRAPLVLGVAAGIGGALALIVGPAAAALISAGMIGGYLHSERFHHAIHHRAPRGAWERFMWRYHYIHHFREGAANIGFTSPLWDLVFRTARWDRSVVVPERAVSPFAAEVPGVEVRRGRGADES
ncbi:MAG: sterol desaturase family protein [Nannocystaceae bacterium]